MAEAPERDGRTEAPTPHRLQKAREEGNALRAHSVAAAAVVLAGAVALSLSGGVFVGRLELTLRRGLAVDPAALQDPRQLLALCAGIVEPGLEVAAVLLGVAALAGFVADVVIGGWVFSARPLTPDVSRIDPAAGLRRLFSRTAVAEIVKSLVKFLVVVAVAIWLAYRWADPLLRLASDGWPFALDRAAHVWLSMFLVFAACLAVLAALELPHQVWEYRDRLKMTRQEVRDELRDLEGSPQTKRRIRDLRQRRARMRMMAEVPTADVVVVNPDHYAAALRYRVGEMPAPLLVAKGTGLVALHIREIADEHRVPIVTAPRLARAICRYVEVDDEIPVGLYPPVAEVLAYVYRLRHAGAAAPPPRPDERFEPPAEFAV